MLFSMDHFKMALQKQTKIMFLETIKNYKIENRTKASWELNLGSNPKRFLKENEQKV